MIEITSYYMFNKKIFFIKFKMLTYKDKLRRTYLFRKSVKVMRKAKPNFLMVTVSMTPEYLS